MSKYYIVDSTVKKDNKNPVIVFDDIPPVIRHLEGMCQRHFNQSRSTFMQSVESLGHGGDEASGRAFYDQMEQYFNIGVLRSDSIPIKTNIFQADAFQKTKSVHGN